jgi:SPP1 family predicted phage head-tail adaptor
MRAGELRHRIGIQTQSETQDAYGAALITYATAATVWGAIWPLAGNELFKAAQIHPEATSRVRIRYYSG